MVVDTDTLFHLEIYDSVTVLKFLYLNLVLNYTQNKRKDLFTMFQEDV